MDLISCFELAFWHWWILAAGLLAYAALRRSWQFTTYGLFALPMGIVEFFPDSLSAIWQVLLYITLCLQSHKSTKLKTTLLVSSAAVAIASQISGAFALVAPFAGFSMFCGIQIIEQKFFSKKARAL